MKKIFILLLVVVSVLSGTSAVNRSRKKVKASRLKYKTVLVKGVSFKMVWVEGGSFYMGAQKKNKKGINYDKYAVEEESPVHRVSLPDFWIGQTEVTQSL